MSKLTRMRTCSTHDSKLSFCCSSSLELKEKGKKSQEKGKKSQEKGKKSQEKKSSSAGSKQPARDKYNLDISGPENGVSILFSLYIIHELELNHSFNDNNTVQCY